MGLRELIPEHDRDTTGKKPVSEENDIHTSPTTYIEIGSGEYKKKFPEEKFERVKDIVKNDFGMSMTKVLSNMSSQKRYEILHDAAKKAAPDKMYTSEYDKDEECLACGRVVGDHTVKIAGEHFCTHHPAAMVNKELREDD
jgi:hypothetical protein